MRLGLSLLALSLAALFASPAQPAPSAGPWIGVEGNRLVDREGRPLRLLGVNRSGAEYACQQGWGIFDGPVDEGSIRAMASWRINAVRVPLNETCWLGINGIDPELGGVAYRAAIRGYVERLQAAGLYVILDLHVAAPGAWQATGIVPAPDADHAPDFWRSVAGEYRDDRGVLFDLYNEPHDIGWDCWERGCTVDDERVGRYRSAGMRELVAAVRSTGARQPLLLGGLAWARNLDQWLEHAPPDPAGALVASNHTYDFAACHSRCRANLERIAARYPVVTGELGQGDCRRDYVEPYMRWADRNAVSYLGWTWNATDGHWTCRGGPSLIRDFDGTPTRFGSALRDHLRAIRR